MRVMGRFLIRNYEQTAQTGTQKQAVASLTRISGAERTHAHKCETCWMF